MPSRTASIQLCTTVSRPLAEGSSVVQGRIDRIGPGVQRGGGRIGERRFPGEIDRVAEHFVHLVLDRLQVGLGSVARFEQEVADSVGIGSRLNHSSHSSCVRHQPITGSPS